MCCGCPHRGLFYALKKAKVYVSGDIGCYTLGAQAPLSMMDFSLCMGASISGLHGFNTARGREQAKKAIAVIGDWESVMGFRALGLDTYPVTSVEEARKTVHDLAKTDCAVIYLTETLAKDMADVLDRYKDNIQPAIILIPGREGSLGIGKSNIQSAIERAVGADIL